MLVPEPPGPDQPGPDPPGPDQPGPGKPVAGAENRLARETPSIRSRNFPTPALLAPQNKPAGNFARNGAAAEFRRSPRPGEPSPGAGAAGVAGDCEHGRESARPRHPSAVPPATRAESVRPGQAWTSHRVQAGSDTARKKIALRNFLRCLQAALSQPTDPVASHDGSAAGMDARQTAGPPVGLRVPWQPDRSRYARHSSSLPC